MTRIGRRERRRLDAVLLLAGTVILAVAVVCAEWVGDHERVAAYWVGAEVAEDGSARVLEVIDYDFGRAKRHGIFRDIPDLAGDPSISVSSPTAPDEVLVSGVTNGTRVRIGDPHITVSGRHRYSISYQLPSVVQEGRLAWDAVGTQWDVPLERVSIHLVAPFEVLAAECFEGELRSTRGCDLRLSEAGRLETEVEGLARFEGVSVVADRGAPAARPRLSPPAGTVHEPSRLR
ncbi:MAG: DUF2207 domain-containing protein, partial [Gemmatimonadota bacterium]|nr:DUF2207 domain-containing protein [Gemmatimonadota bacterium]